MSIDEMKLKVALGELQQQRDLAFARCVMLNQEVAIRDIRIAELEAEIKARGKDSVKQEAAV